MTPKTFDGAILQIQYRGFLNNTLWYPFITDIATALMMPRLPHELHVSAAVDLPDCVLSTLVQRKRPMSYLDV